MKLNKNKGINTASDFESVAYDMMNEFLEGFEDIEGMTEEPTEEQLLDFDCDISFMYTDKAMTIHDRYKRRLKELGEKLFPLDVIEIESGIIYN